MKPNFPQTTMFNDVARSNILCLIRFFCEDKINVHSPRSTSWRLAHSWMTSTHACIHLCSGVKELI